MDIQTLSSGLHIATYTPFHNIFVCSNNNATIQPWNTHTRIPYSTISTNTTTTISQSHTNCVTTTTTATHTLTSSTHHQPINQTSLDNTHICDTNNSHTTLDTNMPGTNTNSNNIVQPHKPQPKPDSPLVKKRVQWNSDKISETLKNQMKNKCDVTIKKLPKKQTCKPIHTKTKFNKLVNRYFPYERDQSNMKPKHAHKTPSDTTDWVALLNQAYSPTKPNMIEVSSDEETEATPAPSRHTQPTTAVNIDTNFKQDLNVLFGDVSSSVIGHK